MTAIDRPDTAAPSAPGGLVKSVVELDRVVIRLAGDSGDGMQLTGNRFTSETASFGNDLSTLPNFPAEIRAPTGTLPGVSSFQLHFADHDIMTPGDAPDVLVAMNPAALKANIADLPGGGLLIVDSDEFSPRNLAKVGYATNPLEDGSLEGWQTVAVPLTSMTLDALADSGLGKKEAERSKNMFTLGLLSWMYHRPTEGTVRFLERQFRRKPEIAAANIAAFRAGYNYGETTEAFAVSYEIKPAPMPAGRYRNISGNQALALGLVAAGQRSGLPLFLGAYPITPASDILHELSKHKAFGVRTFQAEDEIAGISAAIGASFGGALGVTTTSGPGVSLKSEALGLAVMTELPLLVVDVQRGGPSTGLPTKTEQSDLLQAMFGRNGEAPVPVIAPRSPGDCFDAAHRGGPHRDHLPDAGDPAVRRLPGQRRRAVGDPGGRRAARPHRGRRLRDRAQRVGRGRGRGRVPPLPARPGDARPPVGHPRHRGHAAPHRRAGEGRQDRQHLLRPGQPRLHDPHPAGQGRRHRRRPAAHRGRRPGRQRQRSPSSAGDRPTGRSAPPAAGSAGPAARWRRSTCATSTRCRPTSATSWPATTASSARR